MNLEEKNNGSKKLKIGINLTSSDPKLMTAPIIDQLKIILRCKGMDPVESSAGDLSIFTAENTHINCILDIVTFKIIDKIFRKSVGTDFSKGVVFGRKRNYHSQRQCQITFTSYRGCKPFF